MKEVLKLMRVHHYIKNLLVFAALFCSKNLFDLDKVFSCLLAFVSFSLMTSVIYIINDIRDLENDSKHPIKSKRPLAAKKISVKQANILLVIVLILSMTINFLVFNHLATVLLLIYFLINLMYSLGAKKIPVIDVTMISLGYLIRVSYGAVIINIEVSTYLYLVVLFISLYLALGKRKNELKNSKKTKSSSWYSVEFLNAIMNIFLIAGNIIYIIWSFSTRAKQLYDSDYLWITSIIVILITLNYHKKLNNSIDGDPVGIVLKDKKIILMCMLYVIAMFILIYM